MKRLRHKLSSSEMTFGPYCVDSNHPYNNSNQQSREEVSRNKANITLFLLFAIVGTTVFLQTFALAESNELKSQFHQNDELENLAKIKKAGNSLVRVLNAIVLLQDVNENSTVMKKVLAEALNVQNVSLLDSISDKDANNIVQALKTYASLADQKLARTNEITLILKAPALRSDYDPPENTTISLTRKRMENDTTLLKPVKKTTSLSATSFTQTLLTFNTTNFHFNDLKNALKHAETALKKFECKLNLQVMIDKQFHMDLNDLSNKLTGLSAQFNKSIEKIGCRKNENFLESLKLFIKDIKHYEQLTNDIFLNTVDNSLLSLEKTTKNIQLFAKSTNNNRIKEKTDFLNRFFSKKVSVSDRKYLIGFPRGYKDFDNLFNDLDNANIKELLNHGRSLAELKNVLKPVLDIKSQISEAKQVWKNYSRTTHSIAICHLSSTLIGIPKFESNSVLNSLTNMSSILQSLRAMSRRKMFNSEELQTFLNSFQKLLKFKHSLEALAHLFNTTKNTIKIFQRSYQIPSDRNESISKLKSFINNNLSFESINTSMKQLEDQLNDFQLLLANFTDNKKNTMEQFFNDIHKTPDTSQQIEIEIKKIFNNFLFLNFLIPFKVKERNIINQLPTTLIFVKRIIAKWEKIEKALYIKLKNEKDFKRLTAYTNASETTVQLANSLLFLRLYQSTNFRNATVTFLQNSESLVKKIEELSVNNYIGRYDEYSYLSDFNTLMMNILSEIETFPSRFHSEKLNLPTIGNILYGLNNVSIFKLNIPRMLATVNFLKNTRINISHEIKLVEQLLPQLSNFQSAAEVKQNILHELLSEAYGFFSVLFAKYVAYENDGIFWKAVVWIAVMLLACACGPVIYWFRTVIDEVREKSRN